MTSQPEPITEVLIEDLPFVEATNADTSSNDPQSPSEDADPLLEVGERANEDLAGDNSNAPQDLPVEELLSELEDEGEDDEETGTEEVASDAATRILTPEEVLQALQKNNRDGGSTAIISGDDAFDREVFLGGRAGRLTRAPRSRLPIVELPTIDAQAGASGALAGNSGVIAIFCEEQFSNKEKIAECAGRVQILSGWRPDDSFRDYSRAVALIREAQSKGRGNRREFGTSAQDVIGDPIFGNLDRETIERLQKSPGRRDLADPAAVDFGDPLSGSTTGGETGIGIGPGPLGRQPLPPPDRNSRDARRFERLQREIDNERDALEEIGNNDE